MGKARTAPVTESTAIQDFPLWKQLVEKNVPLGFDLELTARCNFNCRHCYVNLPASDDAARL